MAEVVAQPGENRMGTAPIAGLIIRMSLPAMCSLFIQALYNIVDSIYVSRISEDALTAVSLAMPIQNFMVAIATGTSIGINSLIARRLGAGRREEANNAADHGIFLGIICGLFFALLGLFFAEPFFRMMTDIESIVNMGTQYIRTAMLGSFSIFIAINGEKVMQGSGNMIFPMLTHLTGTVINVILDPILIFGLLGFPAMGVLGAAVATIIAQFFSMVVCLLFLFRGKFDVKVRVRGFRFHGKTVAEIYRVGFPSIVMQSISSVLNVLLNMILISFTETAVSVLGAYYKLNSFIFMPLFGLNQGTMPIIGYNFGARNKKRVMSAYKFALLIGIGIMTFGTLLFQIFPVQLLGMFNASDEMLRIGVTAFRLISISFIPAAFGIVTSNMFQAIGHGVKSLMISILRQLVLILPLAWILARTVGLDGVWAAFPLSEIGAVLATLLMVIFVHKRVIAEL